MIDTASALFQGSDLRRAIKREKNVDNIICHPKNNICFILTEKKLMVKINMQAFVLQPVEVPGNLWERRFKKIRTMILSREVNSFERLIKECDRGVELIPISLQWYV